jgi:FAD/FMN-containing dehydrogenase
MRWAARKGVKKVTARGQGHSIYGRSLAEDGVVIDMRTIKSIRHVGADHIVVDAGASWESVLEATLPRGLAPPVLTNYLGLSVGGTLAVGGIGGSSSRHGMQTDHVLSLDIVTGGGEELTCSATSLRICSTWREPGLGNAVSSRGPRCASCGLRNGYAAFSLPIPI